MSDIRCAAASNGDFVGTLRCDAERAWRWIIARLNDDETTEQQVEHQIRDCPDCATGFARYLGGVLAGTWIDAAGKDGALKVAGLYLTETLSAHTLSDLMTAPETGRP
ncbi:hypothetical protein AWC11_11345 [Mycobacterium interjectum]|nr:hypothetical protein AWC11_11345 [Mycobacterium interjectum]